MKIFLPSLAALALSVFPLASWAQTPASSPVAATDNPEYPTADALWAHIEDLKKGPPTRPPTAEAYRAAISTMVTQLAYSSAEFVKRYPDDPRVWDARLMQIEMQSTMARVSGRDNPAAESRQLQDLSDQQAAPASVRGEARYQMLGLTLHGYNQGRVPLADVLDGLKQFTLDFPTYPHLDIIKYKVAKSLAQKDPAASTALLQELASSGEGEAADQARKDLAAQDNSRTQPTSTSLPQTSPPSIAQPSTAK